MPRHPLSAALSCVLLLVPAFAPAIAAEPEVAVAKVKWEMPWKQGVVVDYASESLQDEVKDGVRSRSRSTDTTHVRITEANAKGFVQAWTSEGYRYEVLDGASDEAEKRAFMAAFGDTTLEANLDAAGNYAGLRNLDSILPRLRKASEPMLKANIDAELAKISDPKAREAARAKAQENLGAVLDTMMAPKLIEALLSREIANYNGFFGIELEPDQSYELETELPNPMGGAAFPAKLTFSLSISADDPEDLFVTYDMVLDREKTAAIALEIGEKLVGQKATDADKAQLPTVDIHDEGLFVVHRPTGIIEMYEDTRTTSFAKTKKIERNRLRQLNGKHDHVWRDEDEAADGKAEAAPAEPAKPAAS
jgi:hypothetical protein